MTRHEVRRARARDLRHLQQIEDAADPMFADFVGHPTGFGSSPTGHERADLPGFLLVAGDPPVGFAHLLVLDGHAHLEQVSVHPEQMRRGVGSALVQAVLAEARAEGFVEVSLCTFRDVPWNAPLYAALGFSEVASLQPYQRRLRDHEVDLGLDALGSRLVMSAPTATGA